MMSVIVMQLWLQVVGGALRFEDRFCASKKGGIRGGSHDMPCTWWLFWKERPWSALAGAFLSFLAQTGIETVLLPL